MPTSLTPARLNKMLQEEDSKTLTEIASNPKRLKLYRRVMKDIRDKTESQFTEEEYHHLTVLYLVLDDADAHIHERGGPQNVDPELLNQIRLMREGFLARLKDAREGHETVGSLLKDTKEAMIRLKNKVGEELTVIKTENPETLVEIMEREISFRHADIKKKEEAAKKEVEAEVIDIVAEKTT